MTNLTSEQYREVLRHIPNLTEEIPTVQQLLRRAVETFYSKFGCYPQLGGVAPGKVALFGEQIQFDDGIAIPAATPMVTIIVGRKVPGPRFSVVTSANVGKPHKVNFSFSKNRPLHPGFPKWLNYIKGVIENYSEIVPPFEAAIESSLPMGVGFGSSSAIEIATYTFLEILIGKKDDPITKAKACQLAEKDFADNEVGLVDRLTSIAAKDRNIMLIDCRTNEMGWIPFRNKNAVLIAVDTHLEDTFLGYDYKERSKYLAKACEILGVDSLRECTEDDVTELENRVIYLLEIEGEREEEEEADKSKNKDDNNDDKDEADGNDGENRKSKEVEKKNDWTKEEYDKMIRMARFFVTEINRISEALEAWNVGDIETFGEKLTESNRALKDDFDFHNPLTDFLIEASLQVEGVFGSRMIGMGLGYGGGIVSLVNKKNITEYCSYIAGKFSEFEEMLGEIVAKARLAEDDKHTEIAKRYVSEHLIPVTATSEKSVKIFEYLKADTGERGLLSRDLVITPSKICVPKGSPCNKKEVCSDKLHKNNIATWARYQKESKKEMINQKINKKKPSSTQSTSSEGMSVALSVPSFYIISPFPGARMMIITKADLLRSRFANCLPHPKAMIQSAMKEYKKVYGSKAEVSGAAPGTICIFGEFMEYHLGCVICMALPMYCVMVGGKNDSVLFSVQTNSKEVEQPHQMKYPLPSVRGMQFESRTWVNYVMGVVNEFNAHVPGFNAIINSSVPIKLGIKSSSAFQACIYSFLENLTKACTDSAFRKAEKCAKNEYDFFPSPGEQMSRYMSYKFFPTFMCKDGHLLLIDCKNYKMSHHYFDHPSYAFIIACCKKNDPNVTMESLEERLRQCVEAIDILGRATLINLDVKHIRCLQKRDASENVIKRAKYVITEHQRILNVLKAIKDEDYERVGFLMTESHASLRDDYEVSSPQIEELVGLALSVEGVLGAKMLGNGLKACIIILIRLSEADKCIRYMKKNYKDKTDKPVFYIVKPSRGAFISNPKVETFSQTEYSSYRANKNYCS